MPTVTRSFADHVALRQARDVDRAEQLERSEGRSTAFGFAVNDAKDQNDYLMIEEARPENILLSHNLSDIRFVTVGSQMDPRLADFVNATFGPVSIHAVSKDRIHGLSSQSSSYQIIVALFDDVTRAKRALRELKPVLDNKLCYAIMTESTPKERAELLRFAFDDVLDTRMKPAEVIARMQAHWFRQAGYNQIIKGDEKFQIFCEQHIEGRVLIGQMELLRKLHDNVGKVVRYRDLASFDFSAGDFRFKSLSVRIHHLRKRLRNCEIICKRGLGYVLIVDDPRHRAS